MVKEGCVQTHPCSELANSIINLTKNIEEVAWNHHSREANYLVDSFAKAGLEFLVVIECLTLFLAFCGCRLEEKKRRNHGGASAARESEGRRGMVVVAAVTLTVVVAERTAAEDVGGCETRRTPAAGCGGGGKTRAAERRHVRVRQWLRSPVRAETGVMVTCDMRLLSVELREGEAEVRVAAVMAIRRKAAVSGRTATGRS
ncbi:putative ribonuclease H protein [Sesbania bispinosa]|nr:putative ribonuclease H protein [Sesbania bispinosa]